MISFFKKIANFFSEDYKVANILFTLIILFISLTSFFHVVKYWMLTNKAPFYYITAVATELIIIGSMMAIKYTRSAWIPFVFGILIQGIGNVFYSFLSIDVKSLDFIQFTELFNPAFFLMYGDELEIVNYKRILASFNGLFYLSPIMFLWAKMRISSKLKMLKAIQPTPDPVTLPDPDPIVPPPTPDPDPLVPPNRIPIVLSDSNPDPLAFSPIPVLDKNDSIETDDILSNIPLTDRYAYQHVDAEAELIDLLNKQILEDISKNETSDRIKQFIDAEAELSAPLAKEGLVNVEEKTDTSVQPPESIGTESSKHLAKEWAKEEETIVAELPESFDAEEELAKILSEEIIKAQEEERLDEEKKK